MFFLIFFKLSAGKGFYSLVTLCYFNKLNLYIQKHVAVILYNLYISFSIKI